MQPDSRSYIRFAIYRLTERWRELDTTARAQALNEFAALLEEPHTEWQQCYSLVGLRADVDFCIWLKTSDGIGPLQQFERRIRATTFGDYIELSYNFMSMTKPSAYAQRETDPERAKLHAWPDGAPYLFVYPMVKSRDWYKLQDEERGRIMRGHIAAAHKYPKIRINTSYSYGLDDQEFVVAFEGDDPAEFLDLVHDLRFTEASAYTVRDTPMFTCVLRSPRQLAEELGAVAIDNEASDAPAIPYYPIFMVADQKPIAVYGGGEEATHKVRGLLRAGARITVIAPTLDTQELLKLAADGAITHLPEEYDPEQLDGFALVLVARDDTSLNSRIATDARAKRILVNAADDVPNCDWILPAIVREGDLTLAISTAGKSPAIARRMREELTEYLAGEFPALLEVAGEVRTIAYAANRMPDQATWQAAITPKLRALCVKGNVEDAKRLMLEDLGLPDLAEVGTAEPR